MALTNVQGKGGQKIEMPAIFPWPMGELIVPEKGCGLGDPLKTTIRNMAQPWREQIAYIVFIRDLVKGDLTLPGGTTIDWLVTGAGEVPPSNVSLASWVQNISGTNLFPKGAPIPRDYLFATLAMGVSIGRPFFLAKGDNGSYLPARIYAPTADSYGARARDLLWSSWAFNVSWKDSACDFDLGAAELYPPHAAQLGGETVRSGGAFPCCLGMIPIDRGPVYFGGPDEETQGKITGLGPEESITLVQDPEAVTTGDLAVPMRIILYGEFGRWCGPCSVSQDEVNAMVEDRVNARMKNLEARVAQLTNGK